MTTTHEFDRYAEVSAALADASLVPPPAEAGPPGTMAWLRGTVSRFAAGATHARRRALIEADLARLDPAALRAAIAAGPEGEPRRLVVRTLASALDIAEPDAVADAVAAVSKAYFGGDDPEAEAAIAWLLPHVAGPDAHGEADLEAAANRIALLVQSCDATGGLVEAAQRAGGEGSVRERLAWVVREDPPVRPVRRVPTRSTRVGGVDIDPGDVVVLDLGAANHDAPPGSTLTFGSGVRPCPGQAQALALAAGLLERDPARVIERLVDHVLTLAQTWTVWSGQIVTVDDREYTPHKAIRRVTDHLIDHLAEVEARLAGVEPLADHWHGSAVTTPADRARFTAEDLDEARSRLTRLAAIWTRRLTDLSPDALRGEGWTVGEIATHLDGSRYYADAIGALS